METRQDDMKTLKGCDVADTTILDVLNADCWRLILDHVSINDIVRSERVSRAWQRLVHNYLAGVHSYRIDNHSYFYYEIPKRYWNYHIVSHKGDEILFEEMSKKLGPLFVKIVTNYIDESRLRAIVIHCPNLESLTFYRTLRNLPLDLVKKCKQLKRIEFDLCALREDYLNEMITSETLEELKINNSSHVTGRFLTSLNKHLKSLALSSCDFLLFKYIQSAAIYLNKLTRLELNQNSSEILQNVHLLLDRMPDLEHLSLMGYHKTDLGGCVAAAIGRLSRLKVLHLWGNKNVTDEWLAAAAGCPELRTLNVGFCSAVSGRGVVSLCRSRPTLVELVVAGIGVTETDLEACVRYCRDIELLDAALFSQATERLPKRLARPRARPLLVRLNVDPVEFKEIHYEGLTLRWDDTAASYHPLKFDECDEKHECLFTSLGCLICI